MTVPSARGTLALPQTFSALEIHGRQSMVYITDYNFGARSVVHHTTAAIFLAATIGARDVLFLTGDTDKSHEVSLALTGENGARSHDPFVRYTNASEGATVVMVHKGREAGVVALWDSDEQLVLFSDPVTAGTFWAPAVRAPTARTVAGLEAFWQFGTNTTVLVGGPYLVRNATLEGATLALWGDLNASVPLTVVAPESVRSVVWNGERVEVDGDGRGGLTGRLEVSAKVREVKVPELGGWRYKDSLPEIGADFDDGHWVVADHTSTNITQGMLFGDGRVLYGKRVFFYLGEPRVNLDIQVVTMACESILELSVAYDLLTRRLSAARTTSSGAGTLTPPVRRLLRT